ncbi:MAG: PQQ-binding-like beta-propeller repeat protein [Phycisphaeraceae bacterium]|nr:PQQ-binding-like beta-propeller repeat protein [Phycisphaeraceae bacterium]
MNRTNNSTAFTTFVVVALSLSGAISVSANDWPTRLYDIRRCGTTPEQLLLPLVEQWNHKTIPPAPAWTESPSFDGQTQSNLKPRQNFDVCFDVVVAGHLAYFGSSSTGAVQCLDVNTGKIVWTFVTDGPVRLAPQLAHGRVYVGSDDGYAYCLEGANGTLIWKDRAGPNDRMLWGNGRLISVWPVRSSLLVDGDSVFWTAGLFPREGMFVCKRNALDGTGGWTKPASRPSQGYLVAGEKVLYVPGGKGYPVAYDRDTGDALGNINASGRDGGTWALLSHDETRFWSGPFEKNAAYQFDAGTRDHLATVANANYLILDAAHAYYVTNRRVVMTDLADQSVVWGRNHAYPYALIKAGNLLFVGGESEIAAFDSMGTRVWTAPVDGMAYGLAVANGHLFASTDNGTIHCFGNGQPISTPTKKVLRNPFETHVRSIHYRGMAQEVLRQTGIDRGTCLILGCDNGHFAYEMAKEARGLQVHCIELDSDKVSTARKNLGAAGVYQTRVRVEQGDFTSLPRSAASADLILLPNATRLSHETEAQRSDTLQAYRKASAEERKEIIQQAQKKYLQLLQQVSAEALRVLKPSGGVLYVDLTSQSRGLSVAPESMEDLMTQPPFDPNHDTIEVTNAWIKLTRGKPANP